MQAETVIKVDNVHIRYKVIKAEGIKKSFFSLRKTKMAEIEAVKGVSFEVKKGQIVGLVGKNGSGKSTLLRSIAGIFSADEGSIDIGDHSISLLSIGVGFNKELTGKENIYLSGLLLGFTKEQVQKKYKEIVEFSGLGSFINMPVRTYSSGMYSKLAFSITAVMETEIILIDEVLSVGDMQFKKKSFRKMRELISQKDRTVIIVSHSNETVRKLCDRVIWLDDGLLKMDGETEEVLTAYEAYMDEIDPEHTMNRKKAEKEERIMRMVEEEDLAAEAESDPETGADAQPGADENSDKDLSSKTDNRENADTRSDDKSKTDTDNGDKKDLTEEQI